MVKNYLHMIYYSLSLYHFIILNNDNQETNIFPFINIDEEINFLNNYLK